MKQKETTTITKSSTNKKMETTPVTSAVTSILTAQVAKSVAKSAEIKTTTTNS